MGSVNGETMTRQRFDELVERAETNYKMNQQVAQIPAEMQSRIRESVWAEFVEETLFEEQAAKLGLQVTSEEMGDMYTGKSIGSLAGLGGAAATLGTILTMLFIPMLTAGDNWTPFFIMGASLVPLSLICVFAFGGKIEHEALKENK